MRHHRGKGLLHERAADSQRSKLWDDGDRYDVAFPCEAKFPYVRETVFEPAHYVADDLSLGFGDDESFRKRVVRVKEEVGRIVLRKAYAVYVHHSVEVARSEPSKAVVSLNQQLDYSKSSCKQQIFDII